MAAFLRARYDRAVPRYFFHLFNDETVLDEEGQELSDPAAARSCAIKEARAVMTESLHKGEIVLSHHIVVEDEQGLQLWNVTFGDALTIRP